MKITYNGSNLDINTPFELKAENNLGFKVTVSLTVQAALSALNSFMGASKRVNTYNNCCEVHYLYETHIQGEKRVAIESSVHGTSFTLDINNIESIVIEQATHIEPEM